MALTIGVNSYITLDYAIEYALDRDGTSTWLALDGETQEQTLISAADVMETFSWGGTTAEDDPVLSWPRTSTYWDPKSGKVKTITAATPVEIGEAQVELAIDIGTNGGFTGEDSGGNSKVSPDTISVGSISLGGLSDPKVSDGYIVGRFRIPAIVMNLISHLLAVNNSGAYGGIGRPVWRAW